MKAYAGYKAIKTGAGRPIYVRNESYETFATIVKEYRRNYHMTTIMRSILSVNADALRGKGINPAGDERVIQSGHVGMRYSLHDGAVFIQTLVIGPSQNAVKTGLYSVEYSKRDDAWLPSDKPISSLNQNQQWKSQGGKADYAAVVGKFDSLGNACELMPEHILGGFKKADFLTSSDIGSAYSLFWSEKGEHRSDEVAQALASIMQQSTKNNLPVNWLVHGDGIHAFSKATKIINSQPLATASTLAKKPNAGKAGNQNVFFSNPASSASDAALKRLCEDAGMGYAGLNTNHRDLRRWSTFKNVGREMGKLASIGVATTGAVGVSDALKSVGAGGADKVIDGGINAFITGNYLAIGASAVALGFIAASALSKTKIIAAGAKCTFGKGNQRWYTDDQALLTA